MDITEVRIKLMEDSDDRLRAFCSITFDDAFVVRDLKIIDGSNGPFVAMPSRKLTSHCPKCGYKNHLRAAYCSHCGTRMKDDRAMRDQEGRTKLYADIAHPINSQCREMIQDRVIAEYNKELELAKQPGYVSRYDDEYEELADAPTSPPPKSSITTRADKAHSQSDSPAPRPHTAPAKDSSDNRSDPAGGGDFGAGIF